MIQNYIAINRILRNIINRTRDATEAPYISDDITPTIISYLKRDIRELERIWPTNLTKSPLIYLKQSLKDEKYNIILDDNIPEIEDQIDNFYYLQSSGDITTTILDYLHPVIINSSYNHFKRGNFRESVLNALMAVFELIRKRTKIDKDGADLVGEVFSLQKPKLAISNLETESGKNEQKGFIQILQGAYLGIRNPKAHTLITDLNEIKTAQYLIFASLLAGRVDEASLIDN